MSQQTEDTAAVTPLKPLAPGRTLRKNRSPWPVRIGVLVTLAALVALAPRLFKKKPIEVETVKAERTAVSDEISSSTAGEVLAERSTTVRAEVSGRAMLVRHKTGERIKKGELVIGIDPSDLDARLEQAKATLVAQQAQADQSKAHADAALRTAERNKKLAEHGAETQRAAEDAEATSREAQAAAKSGLGLVQQAEAAYRVAQVARSKASLTAPFDGLLSDVPVNQGEEVQLGAVAFEIIDDSRLHVEATVDEADIGRVHTGQEAALHLDALPKTTFKGSVSKTDPTVRKDSKGARTLRIEVDVANLPEATAAGLRPGMSANVDVRVAEKANVLSLPSNVIVGRGTRRSVFTVKDGVARETKIEIGISNWERSEIVSGLVEGDVVISSLNVKDLADGVAVKTP